MYLDAHWYKMCHFTENALYCIVIKLHKICQTVFAEAQMKYACVMKMLQFRYAGKNMLRWCMQA